MDQDIVPEPDGIDKSVEEPDIRFRDMAEEDVFEVDRIWIPQDRGIDPIADGAALAAMAEPGRNQVRRASQGAHHHLLMVSLDEMYLGKGRRMPAQLPDHPGARRSPVYQVAEKDNETRPLRAGGIVGLDQAQDAREFVLAAMHIADGIDPLARASAGAGRRLAWLGAPQAHGLPRFTSGQAPVRSMPNIRAGRD